LFSFKLLWGIPDIAILNGRGGGMRAPSARFLGERLPEPTASLRSCSQSEASKVASGRWLQ
jgi:hypothetical protein